MGFVARVDKCRFTFAELKELAGASGLPIQELTHLQQKQLPAKGASKSQLLDAIDNLLNEQSEPNTNVEFFVKEIIRRKPFVYDELDETLQRFGWYLDDETPCRMDFQHDLGTENLREDVQSARAFASEDTEMEIAPVL